MPFFGFLRGDKPADFVSGQGMVNIMANNPVRYLPVARFIQHVLRGPSALTVPQRELIAAYVSALNGCEQCAGSHLAVAVELGVEPGLIEDLLADLDNAPVDPRIKPLLRYAKKLTQTPYRMVEGDAKVVFEAGWEEATLGDVVAVCALFAMVNRIVDGHGVERQSPENLVAGAKRINEVGYAHRLETLLSKRGLDVR